MDIPINKTFALEASAEQAWAVLGDILVNRTGASVAQVKEVFPGFDGTTIGVTSAG